MPREAKKAEFIRSLPRDMAFKEVQRRARSSGLGTVGKSYVQKIRGAMLPPHTNGHANGHSNGAAAVGAKPINDVEETICKLIVVLGTARIRQILDTYESGMGRALLRARQDGLRPADAD